MKMQVDLLVGSPLAWAVVRAMGHTPHVSGVEVSYRTDHGSWAAPRLSDAEAGELMAKHWIGLERPCRGQTPPQWRALADCKQLGGVVDSWSPDFALAVHRCLVKSRFGESLDVPVGLAELNAMELQG